MAELGKVYASGVGCNFEHLTLPPSCNPDEEGSDGVVVVEGCSGHPDSRYMRPTEDTTMILRVNRDLVLASRQIKITDNTSMVFIPAGDYVLEYIGTGDAQLRWGVDITISPVGS